MTDQNQHQQQSLNATTQLAGVKEPLKLLHDTVQENLRLKTWVAERLTTYRASVADLQSRLSAFETENTRLKARLNSTEADNVRLNADNVSLLKAQKMLDAAIRMACDDVSETSQFIDNATRANLSPIPGASPSPRASAPSVPDLAVVRKQTPTAFAAPAATAVQRPAPVPGNVASAAPEAAPAAAAQPTAELDLDAMAQEIESMLKIDTYGAAGEEANKAA